MSEAPEKKKRKRGNIETLDEMSRLAGKKGVHEMLEAIIETSAMRGDQKEFLRQVVFRHWNMANAYEYATGKKPKNPQQLTQYRAHIMETPEVQEFVTRMKNFYLDMSPVAAIKEMEIIMNPNTKDGIKLEAIKDIQDRAGIRSGKEGGQLPVNVIINIPTQTNVKVDTK